MKDFLKSKRLELLTLMLAAFIVLGIVFSENIIPQIDYSDYSKVHYVSIHKSNMALLEEPTIATHIITPTEIKYVGNKMNVYDDGRIKIEHSGGNEPAISEIKPINIASFQTIILRLQIQDCGTTSKNSQPVTLFWYQDISQKKKEQIDATMVRDGVHYFFLERKQSIDKRLPLYLELAFPVQKNDFFSCTFTSFQLQSIDEKYLSQYYPDKMNYND